jgi:formylglycine-generating enzyme required for sulfatase activity
VAWNHGSTPQDENGNKSVMTVGLLLPNAYGLYDTLGNASELVRDIFDPEKPALTGNPSGPEPLTADIEEPMGWTDGAAASLQGEVCMGMYRGGSCARIYSYNHSASRRVWKTLNSLSGEGPSGFRLWIKGE